MRKVVLIGLFMAIALTVQAQSAKKLFKEAEGYFYEKMYGQALDFYLQGLKLDSENPKANFNTGICYLETAYKEKSLPYLKKAQRLKPDIHEQLLVFLGEAYQYNHQFAEAIQQYEEFLKKAEKNSSVTAYVNRHIYECNNGIRYMKEPVKAIITNIGPVINSKDSDFAPVISADETILVFTSRREGSTGEELSPEDGQFYEDMYISYKANGNWTPPRNLKEINTSQHDACVALSPDGKQLFIYKDKNGGDLYFSNFDAINNIWSKPESLGSNVNTKDYETSISMTADGNIIYFSSNRPGGSGGLDIYMSKKTADGKWGTAVNLGPTINTTYDEDAPFIHADGHTLYFSSRGHAGMGNYDIYRSELKDDGTWSTPENLGYPINTADQDIYFVLSADNKHGYYASAKEGGKGEKDIYIISMPPRKTIDVATEIKTVQIKTTAPVIKTVEMKQKETAEIQSNATIVRGKVIDAETKQPLVADIVLVDNSTAEQLEDQKTDSTGAFNTFMPSGKNYNFSAQKEGYLFHSENFDIPQAHGFQQLDIVIELKKIDVGSKIVLRNIFFDFDKATLRKESTAELENLLEIMQEMPKLKIEISGHTDNKGSAEYNKSLSAKRAKAVVDYLIAKGIDASRMRSAGYGKDRPMATNDTDEGRQLNRRTEFEIIGK